MATVYPTAAGDWSTRTWNDDSTGAAYASGTPQTGDTVLANNLAITIDQDVTVVKLSDAAGSNATAGGTFTTDDSGVTVTADVETVATAFKYFVTIAVSDFLAGDATNSAASGFSTACLVHGQMTGDAQAGAYFGVEIGTTNGGGAESFGLVTGNCYGSETHTGIAGANCVSGKIAGNCYGATTKASPGADLAFNARAFVFEGDAIASNGIGIKSSVPAFVIFKGDATGGSVSGAHGVQAQCGLYQVDVATGTTAGAFGLFVSAGSTTESIVWAIIGSESGSYPKDLTTITVTDWTYINFLDPSSGGGGSSYPVPAGLHAIEGGI